MYQKAWKRDWNHKTKECADNLHIDIRAETKANFEKALQIAFSFHTVRAYDIDKEKGLVLLWSIEPGSLKFPDSYNVTEFAWKWLQEEWDEKLENRVACDPEAPAYGSSDVWDEKGFRVYNERWGHVGNYSYAVCAIQPAFIWIGK